MHNLPPTRGLDALGFICATSCSKVCTAPSFPSGHLSVGMTAGRAFPLFSSLLRPFLTSPRSDNLGSDCSHLPLLALLPSLLTFSPVASSSSLGPSSGPSPVYGIVRLLAFSGLVVHVHLWRAPRFLPSQVVDPYQASWYQFFPFSTRCLSLGSGFSLSVYCVSGPEPFAA